jgi:hypothetical protein
VIARAPATTIMARETRVALAPLAAMSVNDLQTSRLSLVVRGAAAGDRCPPYGVRIAAGTAAPLDAGMLALFGGSGAPTGGGLSFTFDVTPAVLRLTRAPGFDPGKFTAVFVRRGLIDASGQDIVANDGVPLRVGAVELVRA